MANSVFRNFVLIIGIADPAEFPVITPLNPHTQVAVQETLTIPTAKPDVEQINIVLIEATITNSSVIVTPTGLKVVVEGTIKEKIIYTASVLEQSLHSALFEFPFSTFIDIPLVIPIGVTVEQLLATLGLSLANILAGPVNVLIEDVEINLINPRTIEKCVILFIYTTLNAALGPVLP